MERLELKLDASRFIAAVKEAFASGFPCGTITMMIRQRAVIVPFRIQSEIENPKSEIPPPEASP